jgi:hypothetical protein
VGSRSDASKQPQAKGKNASVKHSNTHSNTAVAKIKTHVAPISHIFQAEDKTRQDARTSEEQRGIYTRSTQICGDGHQGTFTCINAISSETFTNSFLYCVKTDHKHKMTQARRTQAKM